MTDRERGAPPGFAVRAATPDDLDALGALYGALDDLQRPWRAFVPREDPLAEALARFRAAIADPRARLAVAAGRGGQAEGRIVGMGLAHIEAVSSMSDEEALDLSNVVVDEGHRGRGIGRAIVADLIAFGSEEGVRLAALRAFVGNDEAVAFWSALGFRPRFVQLVGELSALTL